MKISRELDSYIDNLDDEVMQIVNEVLQSTYTELVQNAPKDTGGYANQMKIERAKKVGNSIVGSVSNDVKVVSKGNGKEYLLANILEHGTKPHLIEPVESNLLHFKIGDKDVFTKLVHHPGTKPQPHWQPAYEKASIKLDKMLGDRL